MGITTLTANQPIQPTKPYFAGYYNASAYSGNYFTVLNVTSGKGVINKLHGYIGVSTGGYGTLSQFRVTVDGGTPITISTVSGSGYLNGVYMFYTTTLNFLPSQNLIFQAPIYFTKSVLVEAYSNNSNTSVIECGVQYSLV